MFVEELTFKSTTVSTFPQIIYFVLISIREDKVHGTARPVVEDEAEGLQVWRVACKCTE
jgi:hypothetical protein